MKSRTPFTPLIVLLALAPLAALAVAAEKTPRPNIVVIMADDMGYSDLGCYGGEIRTPNIDSLAEEGLRFTHFYNNALCMPTRASLLTGLYPGQVGQSDTASVLCDTTNVTLAEVLREAGYRTLMSGKWHNGHRPHELPVSRGFDRYWGLLSGCSNYFNPGLKRPGEPDCTWADISKIKSILGWRPRVSFEEGVQMMLENIDYLKDAPVWTPDSIGKATEQWFKYLAVSE